MVHTRTSIAVVAAFVLILGGCDSLLDTEPRQSVSPDVATGTVEGIESTLTGAYTRLQERWLYGQRLTLVPDALADIMVLGGNPSGRLQSEIFNATSAGVGGATTYYRSYQLINEANIILDAVDNVQASESQANRIKGEAYFLRALSYHNLARIYGYEPGQEVGGFNLSVILRTEPVTDAAAADLRSRATNTEVYAQIKSDLSNAISLLQGASTPRTRATAAGAEALMARVLLYESDWSGAEEYATRAMNNTTASLTTGNAFVGSYAQGVNPETIFQVSITPTEVDDGRNEGLAAVVRNRPNHWGDMLPSPELLSLFEDDDLRLEHFDEIGGQTYTAKYNHYAGSYADNVPVIRYPEMLLIRAEARAEQGNVSGALSDLNELREARNASELDLGSASAVIDAVLEERMRELNFEGHRFFDLKRRGMDITKAAATNTATVPYEDRRMLTPLPTRETDLNEHLVQNPGY